MVTTLGKRMIGSVAVVMVFALSTPMASASPWSGHPVRDGYPQAEDAGRRPYGQDQDRRDYYQRREGREGPRPQRLSPEERQQLRRDIKDAGREIYPARR